MNFIFHGKRSQYTWGSGGTVSSAMGPWESPSGGSEGKDPEECQVVYVWRVNNSLK